MRIKRDWIYIGNIKKENKTIKEREILIKLDRYNYYISLNDFKKMIKQINLFNFSKSTFKINDNILKMEPTCFNMCYIDKKSLLQVYPEQEKTISINKLTKNIKK